MSDANVYDMVDDATQHLAGVKNTVLESEKMLGTACLLLAQARRRRRIATGLLVINVIMLIANSLTMHRTDALLAQLKSRVAVVRCR